MLSHTVILALIAAVGAVPLNIDLGAYSPALVVGDGEISFAAGSDVSGVLNSLQGAAICKLTFPKATRKAMLRVEELL